MDPASTTPCTHHWMLASNGSAIPATCKHCGATRIFRPSELQIDSAEGIDMFNKVAKRKSTKGIPRGVRVTVHHPRTGLTEPIRPSDYDELGALS